MSRQSGRTICLAIIIAATAITTGAAQPNHESIQSQESIPLTRGVSEYINGLDTSAQENLWRGMREQVARTLDESSFHPSRVVCITAQRNGIFDMNRVTFDLSTDNSDPLTKMKNAINYFSALPGVKFCEPDYLFNLTNERTVHLNSAARNIALRQTNTAANGTNTATPPDPFYGYEQPYLGAMGYETVWAQSGFDRLGEGAVLWLVDSGANCEDILAPDGSYVWRRNPDINYDNIVKEWNFADNNDNPCSGPMHWHGPAGLSVIASEVNDLGIAGIAPKAEIHVFKVFDEDGRGYSSWIAAAINIVNDKSQGLGRDIVNLSLGAPASDPLLNLVISYGRTFKNITFVASAGNDGTRTPNYPAAYDPTLAVAALTFGDPKARAPYSNYGPWVDLSVPTGDVNQDENGDGRRDGVIGWTCVNGNCGYYLVVGTSASVWLASASTAVLVSQGILGADTLETTWKQTAEDVLEPGFDEESGYGMLRIDRALGLDREELPRPNQPPVAAIANFRQIILVGTEVALNGAPSFDPDGEIMEYKWEFSDGVVLYGREITRDFTEIGKVTITLAVTDDKGATGRDKAQITVFDRPHKSRDRNR